MNAEFIITDTRLTVKNNMIWQKQKQVSVLCRIYNANQHFLYL